MRLDRKNKIALSSVFQSTHPYKIWYWNLEVKTVATDISIHASVQNTTSAHQDRYSSRADFNPRTRTECNPNFSGFSPHNQDFNPRIHAECDGNNINVFRILVCDVQFLNQSLTQFRVCFMSYLGDFRCEPLRKFLWALSSHQGGVEPPTFILILYTKFIYLSRCY